jgi:polyhydroxyalkanoate synthesis regulator phasin
MSRRLPICLALLVASSGCTNPRIQANIAQNLTDVANELSAQRQDMAMLQEQIDSLKQVTAKQDTIIKRLVNVTGIPGLP